MEKRVRVLCPENEELVTYLLQKRKELAEKPKGLSENIDMTLSKAYNSICSVKTPIKTLKELSQIKGVGKWILKLMQGYFDSGSGGSEPEKELPKKGNRARGTKRYMPQRNSVAYALLITLYRGAADGSDFMRKQELIDAADASGLSRAPVGQENGRAKSAHFGSSPSDWYTGWSCMKTLINKGLVVKSSCPAKYMLTDEGREAARDCLMRSHMEDPMDILANKEGLCNRDTHNASDPGSPLLDSADEVMFSSIDLSRQSKPMDVPLESLERVMCLGYSKEQVLHAFSKVSESSPNKEISALWPAVVCHLREEQVYGQHSEPQTLKRDCWVSSTNSRFTDANSQTNAVASQRIEINLSGNLPNSRSASCASGSFTLRGCSSSDHLLKKSSLDGLEAKMNCLSMPPLSLGERFEDVYEVILILDDREQFAIQCSKGRKLIESICKEHKIKIQVRRLPVGDGIWIALHKYLHTEYVLDFIVERKNVDDLRSSIRDNRYRDQKLRLLRCGLKKLIYLVEGDPNSCEAAESIKTACFTTEILEGFDVQRTGSLRDTLKKYGYITQSITQFYRSQLPEDSLKCNKISPPYDEFIKRCQDLDKITVSDVFAIQLMQVPQVTEEIALAVLDLYPTIAPLAHAYSALEGDVCAQEEMLRKQSNNFVNASASRNIFQLVWGNEDL